MTDGIAYYPFEILKSYGDLNVAETVHGKRVYRQKKIYFPEIGRSVACVPTDNHFVFVDDEIPGWILFCTCGSPAGIVGYQVYKKDASPTSREHDTVPGEMLICLHHGQYGKHLDGSS